MAQLQKNILSTLCYADVFSYPLKEQELWQYLIGRETKLSRFRAALAELLQKKQVVTRHGLYVLKNRTENIPLRFTRGKIARFKMERARRVASLLNFIPTVWLVGVSGALAMHNAPREDDIDLFIITAPGTLWTTRLFATLLLDVFKLRRKPHDTKFRNKICLNMFLDALLLKLPKKEQDLYGAHEVAQMKPLVNKYHTSERFLQSNFWVKKFLPHAFATAKGSYKTNSAWRGRGLSSLESLFKIVQLRYMRQKRTNEMIVDKLLRFHPKDARERVMREYKKRLKLVD